MDAILIWKSKNIRERTPRPVSPGSKSFFLPRISNPFLPQNILDTRLVEVLETTLHQTNLKI